MTEDQTPDLRAAAEADALESAAATEHVVDQNAPGEASADNDAATEDAGTEDAATENASAGDATTEDATADDSGADASDAGAAAGGSDELVGDDEEGGQAELPLEPEVVIDDASMRRALEAILMVTDEPLPVLVLARAVGRPPGDVAAALAELAAEYTEQGRGFDLREVGGGWRYYTRPEQAQYVERFVLDGQQARLTQAALETLAVVAYKQPVSRARVSAIRGVNVDGVMRTLISRGLVEEAGADTESQATLYRTTSYFLERMGMQSLDDLPELAPYLPEMDDVEEELAAQNTTEAADATTADGDTTPDATAGAEAAGAADDTDAAAGAEAAGAADGTDATDAAGDGGSETTDETATAGVDATADVDEAVTSDIGAAADDSTPADVPASEPGSDDDTGIDGDLTTGEGPEPAADHEEGELPPAEELGAAEEGELGSAEELDAGGEAEEGELAPAEELEAGGATELEQEERDPAEIPETTEGGAVPDGETVAGSDDDEDDEAGTPDDGFGAGTEDGFGDGDEAGFGEGDEDGFVGGAEDGFSEGEEDGFGAAADDGFGVGAEDRLGAGAADETDDGGLNAFGDSAEGFSGAGSGDQVGGDVGVDGGAAGSGGIDGEPGTAARAGGAEEERLAPAEELEAADSQYRVGSDD